ncbi:hypothetical protein [Xanthomonas sp. NCPPB 1128]|nr:hypothetical protein [Xanthomonas sp. NCPPB 1128]
MTANTATAALRAMATRGPVPGTTTTGGNRATEAVPLIAVRGSR